MAPITGPARGAANFGTRLHVLASSSDADRCHRQGRARPGGAPARVRRGCDVHAAVDPPRPAGGGGERGLSGAAGVGRRGLEVAQRLRPRPRPRHGRAPRPEPAARAAHGAQAPRRRARGHRSLPREGAGIAPASGLREQAGPARQAGRGDGRAGERARGRRPRRRSQGAHGVREPLRHAHPQPQPDAPPPARRERSAGAAVVGRRGDRSVHGHRARGGGAGGGGGRVHLHAADVAPARRVAGAGTPGRRRRLRAAHGRHLAGRDRRPRPRVRRDGRCRPGARAAADPVGAPRDRRTDGGADRARGAQPARVDRAQRRAAGRRARRPA